MNNKLHWFGIRWAAQLGELQVHCRELLSECQAFCTCPRNFALDAVTIFVLQKLQQVSCRDKEECHNSVHAPFFHARTTVTILFKSQSACDVQMGDEENNMLKSTADYTAWI